MFAQPLRRKAVSTALQMVRAGLIGLRDGINRILLIRRKPPVSDKVSDAASIDVRDLIARHSLADLIKSADDYFASVDPQAIVKKPFNDLAESAEVALTFLHVLKGMHLPKGAVILDFGAGSCWSSDLMAGFGYEVTASDVSERALAIGRSVIEQKPHRDRVRFLLFDGQRLDLPDGSVDAICCLSALHHVPNPEVVIREFARVLKPGGVAGFSEPGPNHSRSAQAQDEMRRFTVIENDVDIDAIWATAKQAGFSNLELGLFYSEPCLVSLPSFKSFLEGERPVAFEQNMRSLLLERRLFFMEKGTAALTSLGAEGLDATVTVSPAVIHARPGESLQLAAQVRNTGKALWRPSDWSAGPVRLGPYIQDASGLRRPVPRCMLPAVGRSGILPGATVDLSVAITAPPHPGEYEISAQMVSEAVAWFGQVARAKLIVAGG
jgi:SAM-dependent methyltransferase